MGETGRDIWGKGGVSANSNGGERLRDCASNIEPLAHLTKDGILIVEVFLVIISHGDEELRGVRVRTPRCGHRNHPRLVVTERAMDLVVKETSLFTVELLVDRIAALASAGGVTTPGCGGRRLCG